MLAVFKAWEADAKAALGTQRHLSLWLNPAVTPPPFLFSSAGAGRPPIDNGRAGLGGPLGGAPAPSPSPSPLLPPDPRSNGPPRVPVQEQQVEKGPLRRALKPALAWNAGDPPKIIGKELSAIFQNCSLRPQVLVPRATGGNPTPKACCFHFTTAGHEGCDGTCYDKKRKRAIACNRLHIDFSDDTWLQMDKSALQPLWDWLKDPQVAKLFSPTEAFKTKMA